MPTLHAGYTNEEVSKRGREIYEASIKPLVEPDRIGDYVVIDIDTGEYEVDSGCSSQIGRPIGAAV